MKDASRDLTGQTLSGRYRILRVLGEGGMGTVYEAEQLEVGRRVAIKVLFASRAKNRVALKRFFREARTIAALTIPQVCQIFEVSKLDSGEPYFVMEKLDGETLREHLQRRKRMKLGEAVAVVEQLLTALAGAHAYGVVHRDVKPENIFLIGGRRDPLAVKLIDFGIAKLQPQTLIGSPMREDETGTLTRAGTVVGTMWYVAPEQARGMDVDARADIWATGVILYELLTGKKPFDAERVVALMTRIVKGDYEPMGHSRPEIPDAFEQIVRRALSLNREARYPSASAFREALLSAWSALGTRTQTRRPTPPPSSINIPIFVTSENEIEGTETIEIPTLFDETTDPSGDEVTAPSPPPQSSRE